MPSEWTSRPVQRSLCQTLLHRCTHLSATLLDAPFTCAVPCSVPIPLPHTGSLAAYARTKYPALILGAISSSSPVEASALFTAYDETVRRVLPPECAKNIVAATAVVQQRLFTSDEAAVRRKELACHSPGSSSLASA